MENEKKSGVRKIIAPTIIGVITMVALTVGATYAYFTVTSTNSFGTSNTASASINSISGVTLTGTGATLSMTVTATSMLSANAGTTYYATTSGVSTSSTYKAITLGTATATGAGTYTCTYTITVTLDSSDTLVTALKASGSTGQAAFYINGTSYDLYSTTFTSNVYTKSGQTLTGITSSTSKYITGGLSVTNSSTVDQTSYLAGTSTKLTFKVTSWSCSLTSG